MPHFETYFAVKEFWDPGAAVHLFKDRKKASEKRGELNAKWRDEWKGFTIFWWILYGFKQLWIIRKEQVYVHDSEDLKGSRLD